VLVVSGDDVFTDREREEIERAAKLAEADTDVHFSVYVGALAEDSHATAAALHRRLRGHARAVLVAVDPGARRVEIITGAEARRWLDDRSCALALLSMISSLTAGDLEGGIVNGLRTLAEHARHPRVLHLDEP
jgi:uncharacterized membrane protein YgcG